jgi:hypothetical protein
MSNKIIVDNLWNGSPSSLHKKHKGYEIQVKFNLETNDMLIVVDAPFFNDRAPAQLTYGSRCENLWEHEVVEIFIASGLFDVESRENYYIEINIGPHGHYYICTFPGEAAWTEKNDQILLDKSPDCRIDYTNNRWHGRISIPCYLIPEPLCGDNYESTLTSTWMMNAFAIHGRGEAREYLAHNPVPVDTSRTEQPNFHQLSAFVPITINELYNDLGTDESTDLQSDTISEDGSDSTTSNLVAAPPAVVETPSSTAGMRKSKKLADLPFRPSMWDPSAKKRAAALAPTVPVTIVEVNHIVFLSKIPY